MTAEKSRLFRAINWKKSNIVQCQAVSGSVSTILSAGLMNLYTVEHVVMPHTSHLTPHTSEPQSNNYGHFNKSSSTFPVDPSTVQ